MVSQTFPAEPASVSELVTFASTNMAKHTYNKDKMKQYPLLFEELALKLIEQAEPGAELTVNVSHRFGRSSVEFRCPGPLANLKPVDEFDFSGQILMEFRDYMSQSYSGGINIISFGSPMSSVDVVIPGLVAAGLSLLTARLLFTFCSPEQVNWIQSNITYPIIGVFIRALQTFVTPTAFLSLAALVISLRMAVTKNSSSTRLILRYVLTSLLAMGVGFFTCTMFHRLGLIPRMDGLLAASDSFMGRTLAEFLESSVLGNFIDPFLQNNPLPMLTLALIIGLAASTYFGSKGAASRKAILTASGFFTHALNIIFGLIPFFLYFALLNDCLEYGFTYIWTLLYSILTFLPGMVILLVVYAILLACGGVSPLRFFSEYRPIIAANFKIGSNVQALPYNKRTLTRKAKLPQGTLMNVLRLGAAINMDGNCLVVTHGILFYIFFSGINLSLPSLITMLVVILLLDIGTPNQPGSYLLAMVILFAFVGISDRMCGDLLIVEVCLGRFYSFFNSLGDIVTVAVLDNKLRKNSQKETKAVPSR